MTQVKSKEKTVEFGPGFPTALIGERINPTGKKKIQELIQDGDLEWITEFAVEQEKAGADIIGINMGMPDIDESLLLTEAVQRVSEATSAPIYIDSSIPEAIFSAVDKYPYKPLVGSGTGEETSYKPLIEYFSEKQAALVLLLQDEKGIPPHAVERVKIAEKILKFAETAHFPVHDLVFDCLAISVGAEPEAAVQTLDCIRMLTQDLKVSTIIGLSNVSFGLPDRLVFNSSFAAVSVFSGLSAAILNPNSPNLVKMIRATEVLTLKDPYAVRYLEFYRSH